jgi:hypothetical protein
MSDQMTVKRVEKPGKIRRAAGWLFHTLADESDDDRDAFQVIADTVMGPTPGRKVARSAAAVGAGGLVTGLVVGSPTIAVIGGVTMAVGGTAEVVQLVRGRRRSADPVADIPKAIQPTDQQVADQLGVSRAVMAKDNLHAILKDIAVGTFKWTASRFESLWSDAKAHEQGLRQMSSRDKSSYNDLLNVAESMGRVQLAGSPS